MAEETLTMVYRPTTKSPYIEAAPSNKGIYQSVFTEAAKRIGCRLVIKRLPKKRAYKHLERGDVDFYPGASFNDKREKIGFFIDNCMMLNGVSLLYREGITIRSAKDVVGYTLLRNIGSTTSFYRYVGVDIKKNSVREAPRLSIERVIKILQAGYADVFAYDADAVEAYLKKNRVEGVNSLRIPIEIRKDYLIFSKKSKHYKESPNNSYDPSRPPGITNLPYRLDDACIAARFSKAIKEMSASGRIDQIKLELMEQSPDR